LTFKLNLLISQLNLHMWVNLIQESEPFFKESLGSSKVCHVLSTNLFSFLH